MAVNASTPGDKPTPGLILCTDKNDAVVCYALGPEKEKKIFASRYKHLLPSEAELKAELLRALKSIRLAAVFRFQLFSVAHAPHAPRQYLYRLRHLPPLGCRRANTSHATCLVRTTEKA